MYTTETPLVQGVQVAKASILATAEEASASAGVPFRPGRLSRIVGRALTRNGSGAAWLCMWDELHREARKITTPSVRNEIGVLDPTGAIAAARVDWERSRQSTKKKALVAGGNQLEGKDQNQI